MGFAVMAFFVMLFTPVFMLALSGFMPELFAFAEIGNANAPVSKITSGKDNMIDVDVRSA